ncbi:MAG: SDR family NAD(P)-dependent oxidoreductase [Acidobacteria bacterium]|nr:MAG: SDR family NAD(P)-dependent oxidoreductase [Acidobacteriota bacterium]REJ99421.1 MAG: SDR family NAD(P)-dependent oxidoreductase [Acidobacteriota bacterium]
MQDLFDLSGRNAVITGSTKGIGKAIAEALAAHGANVVISSRKQDVCEAVRDAINESGAAASRPHGKAVSIPCNISDREAIDQLIDQTHEQLGQIDILVCNAAVNPFYGSFLDIPDSAFEKVMDVNIKSNHWLAQRVAPEMKERRDGVIQIVSSIGGLRGSTVLGAYSISKAADMQLVRNLAAELGPSNVRVNGIAPGLVKTDFARALWENDQLRQAREAETPLRRLGEPEDLAGIAVYLASRAGAWTTGQTFVVDGGVTSC